MISYTSRLARPLPELHSFGGHEWSESRLVESNRGKKEERSFGDFFFSLLDWAGSRCLAV